MTNPNFQILRMIWIGRPKNRRHQPFGWPSCQPDGTDEPPLASDGTKSVGAVTRAAAVQTRHDSAHYSYTTKLLSGCGPHLRKRRYHGYPRDENRDSCELEPQRDSDERQLSAKSMNRQWLSLSKFGLFPTAAQRLIELDKALVLVIARLCQGQLGIE